MTPLVALEQAARQYGRVCPLKGVDVQMFRGQRVGIAGISGSGKSTLARLLTFHEAPSQGIRKFLGQPATRPSGPALRTLRRRSQLVFQDPASTFPHPWTVKAILSEAAAIAPSENLPAPEALLDQV
jgi:oligopeptide transport system ATP-binding protein